MSVIITQQRRGRLNVYHVKNIDEAGVPVSDETYSVGVEVRTIYQRGEPGQDGSIEVKKGADTEGQVVVCVLDRNGIPYEAAYDYINGMRAGESFKSKKAMGYALGTYLMFMDMCGYDPDRPTYQNIEEFRNFLTGRSVLPESGSKVTYRCANTCNTYMSMVKTYLLLTRKDCSAFEQIESKSLTERTYTDIYGRRRVTSGMLNPHRVRRDPLDGKTLPSHPKPEQVKAILKSASQGKVAGVYWGIMTQFRTGVRRGGLLGLTREDICKEKNGGKTEYCIYIRNRVSDKEDQFCKNLYHPMSRDEYRSREYRESYQRFQISQKLYDGLIGYYENSRDEKFVGARKRKEILANTKADSIYGAGHSNYYIFIHTSGKLLSGQTYNNHLKVFFREHGVTTDKGYKKYNCSHQLRESHLMFRGRYSSNPESLLQLARAAGHASPESTMRYFNEFPEDIAARQDLFDQELDSLIPDYINEDE